MEAEFDWRYCPNCGSEQLARRDPKLFSCPSCQFVYYRNVASAVAGIIEFENRIILTKRAKDPEKGKLDLPGGFVDYDETAENALIREVKEELNIWVTDVRYLTSASNKYLYKNVEYPVLDLLFICRPVSLDEITPRDDVCQYFLVNPRDIQMDELAFDSTRVGLTHYLRNR